MENEIILGWEPLAGISLRSLLFLASEKGFIVLKRLLTDGFSKGIGGVFTFQEVNVQKSFDTDIMELCQMYSIPCFTWKDHKSHLLAIVQELGISSAFTVGWKFHLPLELNRFLKTPLIVFHDSLLPKYRGFAPTPTAMLCGDTEIGITALYAVEKVDRGDIILQKSITINESQTVAEVICQQSSLIADALEEILRIIDKDKELLAYPQDESQSTYSIWRSPEDCQIDWSRTAEEISRLVRAVSFPYPGAFTYLENRRIQIDRVEIIEDLTFAIRDYGKIWSIANGLPTVICGTGMLKILEAKDENGSPVLFKKVRMRFH